jgi:hypothetical protein
MFKWWFVRHIELDGGSSKSSGFNLDFCPEKNGCAYNKKGNLF